jgi:hypothetical protein
MKLKILVFVTLEDNFGRFGNKHVTSSSIMIFSIISLLVSLFNVFLITFIIRKKY